MAAPSEQPLRGRTIVTTRDAARRARCAARAAGRRRRARAADRDRRSTRRRCGDGRRARADRHVRLARRDVTPRRRTRRRRGTRIVDPPRRRGDGDRHRRWPSEPDDRSSSSRAFSSRPRWSRPSRAGPWSVLVAQADRAADTVVAGLRRPRVRRRRVHRLLDPVADAEHGRAGHAPSARDAVAFRVGIGGRGVGRGDRHAHAADRVRDRSDDRVGRDEIRPQGQRRCCRSHGARSRPRAHRAARRRFVDSHVIQRQKSDMSTKSHQAHRGRRSRRRVRDLPGRAARRARAARQPPVVHRRRHSRGAVRSVSPADARAFTAEGGRPSISGDGRWIVFEGRAPDGIADDRVSHRPLDGRDDRAVARSRRRCDPATRSRPSSAPTVASSSSRPSSPSTCSATTTTTSAGTSIASSSPNAAVRPTCGSWCRRRREPERPVTTWSSPIRRPCRAAARSWRSPTRPKTRPTASPRSPSST